MSFHGGYDNDDGFGRERPQKEILFRDETMREILSRAVETGSHDIGDELRASISSYSTPPSRSSTFGREGRRESPPRSSVSRQNSNMVNTPPRDSNHGSGGRTYRDAEGNLVETWDGDEEPALRVHNYDPEWNDSPRAPPRTNTGHSVRRNADGDYIQEHTGSQPLGLRTHSQFSPPASEGRASPPIYHTRDHEGNLVQQYDGDSGDLPIRTHYDDDEPQPRPGQVQRTSSGRYY
ncbi:hypothetical protein HOY82DRAFT_648980 [Tuber indicum]|nr:hypothetical protein HOY82DRAFT_648980 [Tuber indicum]